MTYLFNRAAQLAPGNLLDSMAWAVKMTEKVNAVADIEVRLWTSVLSPRVNTLPWSSVVEDLAALMTAEEKLLADSGYIDLAEEGTRFNSGDGFDDTLVRLVHVDADGAGSAQYATLTTTTVAPGMTATAMALGIEMAQRIRSVTGRPTQFGSSVTGPFGQVGFIILSDTIEQVQANGEALAADADWLAMLDERASKAFIPDSGERRISRRIL